MTRSTPIVLDMWPGVEGGLILIVARALGWDAPYFRDPATGRDAAPAWPGAFGHCRQVQVLVRPGPARRPASPEGP